MHPDPTSRAPDPALRASQVMADLTRAADRGRLLALLAYISLSDPDRFCAAVDAVTALDRWGAPDE